MVVNIFYKHSRVKQYLKEGRAMRIETVVNCPRDLACNARLPNLDELQGKARAINKRILEAERAGQATATLKSFSDFVFSNPSAAGAAVTGRQTNGRTDWKMEKSRKSGPAVPSPRNPRADKTAQPGIPRHGRLE